MILFRILTKVRGYMCLFFSYRTKNRAFFMTNLDIVNFGAKLPYNAGADPGFQVRGGAHLKKLRRAEGGAKILGYFV